MSAGCHHLLTVLVLSGVVLPGRGNSPATESATMAKFFVSNVEQCRRHCWYRKSCWRFWHRKDYTRSSGEDNCVLHSSTAVPVQSYPQWTSQDVSHSDSLVFSNGCSPRPCGIDSLCVPSGSSPHFRCLALPAPVNQAEITVDCGEPQTALTNGAFNSTGSSPGDTATFVCDADFTWSSSTLYTVTCQNDGLWFPALPDGECKSAVFSSPPDPFRVPLPVPPATGWQICLQGVYYGWGRMNLDFHSDDAGFSDEVVLQIDHRQNYGASQKRVLWSTTDSAGLWGPQHELMATLPVAVGSSFNLSLVLEENQLQVTFAGHSPAMIPIDKSGATTIPDIYRARSVVFDGDVTVNHADFRTACS